MSAWYSIAPMVDDNVAVATLVMYNGTSDYYVRVHHFDMAAGQLVSTQDFPLPEKTIPMVMQYFEEDSTLILLLNTEYPTMGTENSIFYRLKPYNTPPYTADLIYDGNAHYYSISRFRDERFCSVGELKSGGHSFITKNHNTFHFGKCVADNTVKVGGVTLGIMSSSIGSQSNEPCLYHSETIIPTSGTHTINCQY